MVNEYPRGAYILTMVAAILEIIAAIVYIALGVIGAAITGLFGIGGLGVGVWFLIVSIILFVGASKLKSGDPGAIKTWSILILVFGILGMNIFALIGGILGLIWKPPQRAAEQQPTAAPPPPPPPV